MLLALKTLKALKTKLKQLSQMTFEARAYSCSAQLELVPFIRTGAACTTVLLVECSAAFSVADATASALGVQNPMVPKHVSDE